MAQFNYQSYESVVANAQNNFSDSGDRPKIGYFKLGMNEEALVRINISSVDQIQMATIHKPVFGKKFEGLPNPFAGISCFNELGHYDAAGCPLCAAVDAKHPVIDRAAKKCFIPMLVSYKDATTGQWSAPSAVVWERPAGFAREIAVKLQNYGDLTKVLLKMSRVGSGKDTKYTLDYAVPTVFKPELIPEDFSAFNGWQANKANYWELTADQINDYLATGSFHMETTKAPEHAATVQSVAQQYMAQQPQVTPAPVAPIQPTFTAPAQQAPYGAPYVPQQAQQPVAQSNYGGYGQPVGQSAEATPQRNFNSSKFSF